jgi:hypothetical protein
MNRLTEPVAKLTPAQLKEVEDFAEFLVSRRADPAAPPAAAPPAEEHKISYEGWFGCLAHVHPEMSDKEFKRLIEDEWVRTAED